MSTGSICLFPGAPGIRKQEPLQPPDKTAFWEDITSSFDLSQKIDVPTSSYICSECNSDSSIQIEEDEVICKKCGTSMGYNIDSTAEYRWFGTDDRNPDPTRVGNPLNPLLPESSLGTRIMARPGESRAMRKIRQYHLWNVMPYRERTLWNVFEGLQVRASNAGISLAIVEETKQLYAQVSPLCICRGQQKDALMAACLFESLKRHDTPRRPAEIAEIFKIDMKLITRGVKQFSGLLDEHLHAAARAALTQTQTISKDSSSTDTQSKDPTAINKSIAPEPIVMTTNTTPSTNFKHYLEPAILRLEAPRAMSGILVDLSSKIGNLLDELGICPETTPPSLAACSIAIACQYTDLSKTNADIASVCGISVATLQKCLKRIDPWKSVVYKKL